MKSQRRARRVARRAPLPAVRTDVAPRDRVELRLRRGPVEGRNRWLRRGAQGVVEARNDEMVLVKFDAYPTLTFICDPGDVRKVED